MTHYRVHDLQLIKERIDMLTQEYLKEYLHYDPETGIFTWIKKTASNASKLVVGNQAGRNGGRGYIYVGLGGKEYRAHRLAWLYVYGTFPEKYLDHINGIKTDNRISNLREVSVRENNLNRNIHRNGRKYGCYYNKRRGLWKARITFQGKRIDIGFFTTEDEAHEAYKNYVLEYNIE